MCLPKKRSHVLVDWQTQLDLFWHRFARQTQSFDGWLVSGISTAMKQCLNSFELRLNNTKQSSVDFTRCVSAQMWAIEATDMRIDLFIQTRNHSDLWLQRSHAFSNLAQQILYREIFNWFGWTSKTFCVAHACNYATITKFSNLLFRIKTDGA